MYTNFPEGFICPDDLRNQWPLIEAEMLPIIEAKARRIERFIPGSYFDFEDAVQEGRMTLLKAMLRYDEVEGELSRYVSSAINNSYKTMLYKMLTQRRTPRAFVKESGGWTEVMYSPVPVFDFETVKGESENPETSSRNAEVEEQLRIFNLKMLNTLKGKTKQVFECMVNPDCAFLSMIKSEEDGDIDNPTRKQIASYLGLDHNAVSWCVKKIKIQFTKMVRKKSFNELFGNLVNTSGWSMLHISEKKDDSKFVVDVMKKRRLENRAVKGFRQYADFEQATKDGKCYRRITRYSWGAVLVFGIGGEWRTVVVEGELNSRSGIVTGRNGSKEVLPVAWYKDIVKTLQGEKI